MIKNWFAVITLISVAFFMISSRQNVPVTTLEKRAANSNGFVSFGNVNVLQSENLNGGRTERTDTKVPENGTSKVDKINGTLYYKEASEEEKQFRPKLLCWILADPQLLHRKVIHQKRTWGKRCRKLLVVSSKQDDTFPAVGLNVTAGRQHIASKVTAAWKYIHKHYVEDFDFFIKTDPDTYVVVENLLDFLKDKDPELPHFYGHQYRPTNSTFIYMAGGPGLVLTRESVRRLVTKAFVEHPKCIVDGQGEDWKVCRCLRLVGGEPQDTRDSEGKERFLVFTLSSLITGRLPSWYRARDAHGMLTGEKCCSDHPISFHSIEPRYMYELEYWLYHAAVLGSATENIPWPKIAK